MSFTEKKALGHRVLVHTRCDLVQPDLDIVVPVHAGLFVVKSQSMKQLVLDHGLVVTAGSQRQDLAVLLVPDPGKAPVTEESIKTASQNEEKATKFGKKKTCKSKCLTLLASQT